jgi:glycosyltransferase involved in cell wall biosynthesis
MVELFSGRKPLRVALYAGICVPHDAISNSLRLKLDLIDSWREAGATIQCDAFVHSCEHDDPRINCVNSVADLATATEFRAADVHVFEFGIYYPLFDAVFLLGDKTRAAAFYHNITPPELADDHHSRSILERSLIQRHNLSQFHRVVANSEYSRRELIEFGLPSERLSVMNLPPAQRLARRKGQGCDDRAPVEVLYVGRFVRAKGVLDLLSAVSQLSASVQRSFRLTLAGNPKLSSPDVLAEVERWAEENRDPQIRVVAAPDDDDLAALYADADVFVIPSYHEGYCVPVVEALGAGCQVVAYDSSNLPNVLGDLGQLVPTGDVEALAAALGLAIGRLVAANGQPLLIPTEAGDIEESLWRQMVKRHLETHSQRAFEEGFAALIGSLAAEVHSLPAWSNGELAQAP